MAREYLFERKEDFLATLEKLLREGVSPKKIRLQMPYHLHEVEELLKEKTSRVKFFTFIGALTGTITGFAFTIYTVLDWPMISGGKPVVSIPAFVIIAFALTILFGSLASFAGFLLLSGLPKPSRIIDPGDKGDRFVIIVDEGEKG
jgi:hypothetical protein